MPAQLCTGFVGCGDERLKVLGNPGQLLVVLDKYLAQFVELVVYEQLLLGSLEKRPHSFVGFPLKQLEVISGAFVDSNTLLDQACDILFHFFEFANDPMVKLIPLPGQSAKIRCPLQVERPGVLYVDDELFCGPFPRDLYEVDHDAGYFFRARDLGFGLDCASHQSFEAYFCRPERELIVDGVQGDLLLFDVAGLSQPDCWIILLEGVDADLFILFADGLGLFLDKVYVFEELHFAI